MLWGVEAGVQSPYRGVSRERGSCQCMVHIILDEVFRSIHLRSCGGARILCWIREPSFWEQRLDEMNPCPTEQLWGAHLALRAYTINGLLCPAANPLQMHLAAEAPDC